jgi:hypothetical protein
MLDHSTSRSHAFLGDPHELLAYNLSISDPNAMRSVIEQQPVGLGGEQKSDRCSDGVIQSVLARALVETVQSF